MMKRFLAWALCGCLLFDMVPATAYAAQAPTEVVAQTETEETSTEGNSEVAETLEAGTEEAATETAPGETEEQTSEESLTEETLSEESTVEETTQEVSEETIEESTVVEEESTVQETVTEETPVVEETTENVEAETEEIVLEEPVTEEYPEETEITELVYGTKTTISLDADYDNNGNRKWYSFTAPETGYYNFHFSAATSGSGIWLSLRKDLNESSISSCNCYQSSEANMYTGKMNAGDIVYMDASTSGESGSTELEIKKLDVVDMTKQEDGSYLADFADYTLSFRYEVGHTAVKSSVSMEAKEGKELTDGYYVQFEYKKEGDYFNRSDSFGLFEYNQYNYTRALEVEQGSSYVMTLTLQDFSDNVIAVLDEEITFTTKQSEDAVVIHDVQSTESSIIMDIETVNTRINYCFYAPVNHPEEEAITVIEHWKTHEFSGLKPGTEYYFQFANSNGKVFYETKASTKAATTQVEYTASITEAANREWVLQLQADVSQYKGSDTSACLYYEYVDALGEKKTGFGYFSWNAGAESFSSEVEVHGAFLANTTYDISVWIRLYSGTIIGKEVKSVTTPAAIFSDSAITFTAKQNETTAFRIDYSIGIEGTETETVLANVYYKVRGSRDSYGNSNSRGYVSVGSESNSYIEVEQSGVTYDLLLFIGGVKKEQSVTIPEGSVKLVQVGEGETNAFDCVRTLKVEGVEERTDDLYLRPSYRDENNESYQNAGKIVLKQSEDYQVTVKTAEANFGILQPDTDYDFRWVVAESEYGPAICSFYETVHTPKADIEYTETANYYNQVDFQLKLNKESIKNVSHIKSFALNRYIKKESDSTYRNISYQTYLEEENDYTSDVSFRDLEPDTAYTVSLRYNNKEIGTTNFRTAPDERAIEITGIEKTIYYVNMSYSCTGINTSTEHGGLVCFIREKGEENKWEEVYESSYYGCSQGNIFINKYNGENLKEDTSYEYVIGFREDDYYTTPSKLEKSISGEFQTLPDSRKVSDMGVSAGYTQATLGARFSGNTLHRTSYIHCFYKEKTATDWQNVGNPYYGSGYESVNCNWTINGLKTGTTYDYAIVVANESDCDSPKGITTGNRKVVGEFTTRQNGYTLEIAALADEITSKSAIVSVKAKGSTADSRIKVTLILDNGQEASAVLKQSADYEGKVTFTGLWGETTYTVSKAIISVRESSSYVNIGEVECNCSFTTKEPEVPTGVTLSEEKVSLNAAYANEGFKENFNGKTLKVTVTPQTAAADFIWSSSDEKVATVVDGKVQARGIGTAVITATSAYDEKVKASCEVTVKDYVVGLTIDGKLQAAEYSDSGWGFYKNSHFHETGLYERDANGNMTKLSDYTITSDREDIVAWNGTEFVGKAVGKSYITFTKDGINAGLYITVMPQAKNFGITGFTSSYTDYPAVKTEEGYILAYTKGITYQAMGELSPSNQFNATDYQWSISDTVIATVSETGVITPLKAGKATLKVVPLNIYNTSGEYKQKEVEIVLDIRSLPSEAAVNPVYALENVDKKLGDIDISELLGAGWSWKYPDTPLVSNGVNREKYSFEAAYTGTQSYPGETEIPVYIAKITGVSVVESSENHNQVLEVGEKDSLTLSIEPIYQGTVSSAVYTVETETVDGLNITKAGNGIYKVTANKAGTYSIPFTIKAKNNTTIAKTVYKFKAVEEVQVRSITFTTDTEGVSINGNKVIFETVDAKKNFSLKAVVLDKEGKEIETALQWKSSDKSVADVAATSKNETHSAKVSTKAEGHTVITVTAKDAAGYTEQLDVEIQNHMPRVDTSKATVNIAYDYSGYYGKSLASAAGCVEIVPVYGEYINSVRIFNANGQAEENLKAELYSGYKYLIQPTGETLQTGTYNCILRVTTNTQQTYDYSLKVSVIDKAPTVSVKMKSAINLFYLISTASIDVSVSGSNYIDTATWEDASTGANNGFVMYSNYYYDSTKRKYVSSITVSQQDIRMKNGVLEDSAIARGKLSIKIRGYKKTYTFDNFEVKYTYKKPVLVTKNTSTAVVPSIGITQNGFYLYNKTDKQYVSYSERDNEYMFYGGVPGKNSFDEIECADSDVELITTDGFSYIFYNYNGKEKSKKITFTVDSIYWRESLQAEHTIKAIEPKVYLTYSQLTYNTASKSTAYTAIGIKDNDCSVTFSDVSVIGANEKAQKLLDEDLLLVEWNSEDNVIRVSQDRLDIMQETIPSGTYTYKVTPYYKDSATGKKTALNTVNLKVKIVDKPVTAKISPKGSLDLANGTSYSTSTGRNFIILNSKFANMGSGYSITDYKLVGEYSDYFRLRYGWVKYGTGYSYQYYLTVKESGKLKAKQAYKLAVEYTVTPQNGDSFTVTSNTFTIKPKQTVPKITVGNNNQTLYAGADNLSRTYYLGLPTGYSVASAYGSLDCNKDGSADIVVSGGSSLSVRIADRDAVGASVKGKTYSIPVTVKLTGRDGISVDAKVTIKVKVKR